MRSEDEKQTEPEEDRGLLVRIALTAGRVSNCDRSKAYRGAQRDDSHPPAVEVSMLVCRWPLRCSRHRSRNQPLLVLVACLGCDARYDAQHGGTDVRFVHSDRANVPVVASRSQVG